MRSFLWSTNRWLNALPFVVNVALLMAFSLGITAAVVLLLNEVLFQLPRFYIAIYSVVASGVVGAPLIGLWVYALRHQRRASRDLSHALSESDRLLEESVRSQKALQQAIEAKSNLLSNVSHELRSPLNAIVSYAELATEVAEEKHLDDIAADVRRIQSAATHLTELVDRVLDLSKVESVPQPQNVSPVEMDGFLDDLDAICRPLVPERCTFEIRRSPDLGTIRSDALSMRQIVINLVSNAAKFAPDGTIALEVTRRPGRRLNESGDIVLLAVSDTGAGIPENDLTTIFEPFSRTEQALGIPGVGLGLAISRAQARKLGGEISVQSERGVGTKFNVVIPANC